MLNQLPKIIPHLDNPYALSAFALLVICGLIELLLRSKHLTPLSQRQSSALIKTIVSLVFRLALVAVLAAVGYACYRVREENTAARTARSVQQQAGDCGANVNGSQNQTSVDCRDKDKKK